MAKSSLLSPPMVSTEPIEIPRESPPPVTEAQLDFVQEIRTSRLTFLWKATIVASVVLAWLILLVAGSSGSSVIDLFMPIAVIAGSSFLTRHFLYREMYPRATWVYSIGVMLAISLLMIPDSDTSRTVVPMIGILMIFVAGMLMSVQDTFVLLGISYGLMLVVPLVVTREFPITSGGALAFLLMGLAALLVSQVSGELYSIADWALSNYRKERQTANKLHESRLELEKSLLKQQNLTFQLQEINEELEDARQAAVAAKQFRGQFLANMSHELRTPLNAIIGFSETMLNFPMMYDGTELPNEYRDDMERIYGSGKHLLGIINDILDLSKIDVGRLDVELQPVDLDPIVKGLLSTAVGLVGPKPIQLKADLPDPVPMVLGDPLRVRQVLLNLYSNATKFTDQGHITLGLKCDQKTVTISVQDTGAGISNADKERIFEAFQQGASGVKQKRAGAGLGLAISKQLLELMDGSIWVESEVGKGSTFYISLPRYHLPHVDTEWTEVES